MYRRLRQAVRAREEIVLATLVDAGADLKQLVGHKLLLAGTDSFGSLKETVLGAEIERLALDALRQHDPGLFQVTGGFGTVSVFLEPCHPPPRLLVLGGGHIARPLVAIASLLEFEITVIDDRPSFANKARFPGAHSVVCGDFSGALQEQRIDAGTSVVIVTRGHQYDLECLEQVLRGDPGYVGMIGSRRRAGMVREHLLSRGCAQDRIERVYMPIGLEIGAQTPEEIAVSIAAQLIQARRGLAPWPAPFASSGEQWGLLSTMLDYLDQGQPFVAATVVRTRGSTPRKAGARMLLLPDGGSIGTIGGGCGEAAVRSEAMMLFDSGRHKLFRVSMDSDVDAKEGMACGGAMDVFLEGWKR